MASHAARTMSDPRRNLFWSKKLGIKKTIVTFCFGKDDTEVYVAYAKCYQNEGQGEDRLPQALNLFYNLEFTEI